MCHVKGFNVIHPVAQYKPSLSRDIEKRITVHVISRDISGPAPTASASTGKMLLPRSVTNSMETWMERSISSRYFFECIATFLLINDHTTYMKLSIHFRAPSVGMRRPSADRPPTPLNSFPTWDLSRHTRSSSTRKMSRGSKYTIWRKRCHFAVKAKLQPNA